MSTVFSLCIHHTTCMPHAIDNFLMWDGPEALLGKHAHMWCARAHDLTHSQMCWCTVDADRIDGAPARPQQQLVRRSCVAFHVVRWMLHADCTALTEFWFDHNKLATMHQLEKLTECMPCNMQHGAWHAI
jgi:hypothetical protein